MIVKPKIREFICTTAHPTGIFQNIKKQIEYVKSQKKTNNIKKENVLIVGCSTGYGLSCRIAAAFLNNSPTIGIMLEKPANNKRTATAGWYNTAFFEEFAAKEKIYAKTLNEDAFSKETIEKTINIIKKDLKKIDLFIFSLAAPRRKMPNGNIVSSVLKPIKENFETKTINLHTKEIVTINIPPATEEEIENTVKVMGGEPLEIWINELKNHDVLSKNAKIISFSYEGPKITHKIYKNGTIGRAKQNLFQTTKKINEKFQDIKAYVSINKALVTQASSAIPVVPLYIAILYKVMKEEKLHEGCADQAVRLFNEKLTPNVKLDSENKIRLDDFEMLPKIQKNVEKIWNKITTENLNELTDLAGYKQEFLNMFGFGFENVDYEKEVETSINIKSLNF